MTHDAEDRLVLNRDEADCLLVLRNPGYSVTRIALEAKHDLAKTEAALRKLATLGLVEEVTSKRWLATALGRTCGFETAPERSEARGRPLGDGAERLLDLLGRPTRAAELARQLGVSRESVRQLLLRLHAEGRVAFGDPERPWRLVKRADDDTPLLSRDEERVFSALPSGRAASAGGLRVAVGLSEEAIASTLEVLIAGGLAEAFEGLRGGLVYRITPAGLKHPQYIPSGRQAPPPRLPVQSDRVRTVLQTIADAGALRIRDVKNETKIPQKSINALMQYLKRKNLVAKLGEEFDEPYALTDQGRAVLAEMNLRQAA